MKISTHFTLLVALTLCVVACNPEETSPIMQGPISEEAPITQDNRVLSQQALPIGHPYLVTLQKSKAMQVYDPANGIPLWNLANLVTYHNNVSAIVIPISNDVLGSGKFLVSYFSQADPQDHKTMVMELNLNNSLSVDENTTINGRLRFSKTTGENIMYHNFEDGTLVATTINEDLIAADGTQATGWECFSFCLRDTMDQLPGYLSALCGGSLAACLATANPASCTAAGVCLGYYGTMCAIVCGIVLYG